MEVLLLNRKITDDEIFRIQVVKREDESANQGESIYEQLKREIRDELSDLRNIEDEELYEIIDREIVHKEHSFYIPLEEKINIRNSLFDSFRRLDILQELLDSKDITEIMVNGKDDIFVEKCGKVMKWDKSFVSNEVLENMIQQIVSKVNRVVNVSSPIADARLSDGSRVHIVLPPISLDGPIITIRKFPEVISMERMISYGTISEECANFLEMLVCSGYNIFISGGTNSGKTTFLNALSSYIPNGERVITIEDSAELQLMHIKNIVRLETKNATLSGDGSIGIGDLIRASLRMNPDRIIVGEVRGREALDMLQAMNTGHDGSLSTGHGNSAKDMLSRLETMVLSGADLPLAAIRSQIASALDILIHLGRLREGERRMLEILEVLPYENGEIGLNKLYEFDMEEKVHKKVGELKNKQKLFAAGYRL